MNYDKLNRITTGNTLAVTAYFAYAVHDKNPL